MTKVTLQDYLAAVQSLGPKDVTKDGAPKMKQLNRALGKMGVDSIKQEQRDEFRAMDVPADEGGTAIRVTKSHCNPVRVTIIGQGNAMLWVGEENTVSKEVLNALDDSDVEYERI